MTSSFDYLVLATTEIDGAVLGGNAELHHPDPKASEDVGRTVSTLVVRYPGTAEEFDTPRYPGFIDDTWDAARPIFSKYGIHDVDEWEHVHLDNSTPDDQRVCSIMVIPEHHLSDRENFITRNLREKGFSSAKITEFNGIMGSWEDTQFNVVANVKHLVGYHVMPPSIPLGRRRTLVFRLRNFGSRYGGVDPTFQDRANQVIAEIAEIVRREGESIFMIYEVEGDRFVWIYDLTTWPEEKVFLPS